MCFTFILYSNGVFTLTQADTYKIELHSNVYTYRRETELETETDALGYCMLFYRSLPQFGQCKHTLKHHYVTVTVNKVVCPVWRP